MSAAPSPPNALLPEAARIVRVTRELDDVVTYALDLGRPFPFRPGQFNMLYLFGAGEVAISISGDPADPSSLVHTLRAVGSVTRPLCALRRDDTIGVRGPYGSAWPLDAARGKDVIFVAGGLGLPPMRGAILHVLAHRADYGRVAILYGARTPGDVIYPFDLEAWRRRGDVHVGVTVDRADLGWTGHVGVATSLLDHLAVDGARTVAMMCGPEIMMRFTARALEARGVARGAIFVSLERNMKCGVGLCGHCQLGPFFLCKDGPVLPWDRVARLLVTREL